MFISSHAEQDDLIAHAAQPQFIYTHHWRVGDLLIWDNRCVLHRVRPYDARNHRRVLLRASVR